MTTQAETFFQTEFKRREDLINDVKFREVAIKAAKAIGITAEEWNANKMAYLLFFANEFCSLENSLTK
jgi:hypothetical protein